MREFARCGSAPGYERPLSRNRAENDVAQIIAYLIGHIARMRAESPQASYEQSASSRIIRWRASRTSTDLMFLVKIVGNDIRYKIFVHDSRGTSIEFLHVRHASRRPWTRSAEVGKAQRALRPQDPE